MDSLLIVKQYLIKNRFIALQTFQLYISHHQIYIKL